MWARIEHGTVAEITDIDPSWRFHPDMVWLACDESVVAGHVYADGVFAPPVNEASPATERDWRDAEVGATDWLVNRHRDELDMQRATTLTAEQFDELLTYRQVLRDWPEAEAFPDISLRPAAPAWVSAQLA